MRKFTGIRENYILHREEHLSDVAARMCMVIWLTTTMMYNTTCSSERYRPIHIFVSIRTFFSLGITFTITSRYSGIPTTATRVLMWS